MVKNKTKNKSKRTRKKREFITMVFENPKILKRTYATMLGKRIRERKLIKIAEITIYKQEKKVDSVIYHDIKADVPIVLFTK
jgi:hypothetical protein